MIKVVYISPISMQVLAVKVYKSVKSARIAATKFDRVYGATTRKQAIEVNSNKSVFLG